MPTEYPARFIEDLQDALAVQVPRLVQDFLDLASAAGLEARAVLVKTGVNEARMREVLGRCLEAHARALQNAYAREAERLARRAAEMSPVGWKQVLSLVEACREAGFAPAGREGDRLIMVNPTPRRVQVFWKDGRLWRYRNRRKSLTVRGILLAVGPPAPGGFTDWECYVDCDRHPNVRSDGKFCAGELRGRDLLAEDAVRALVTAVEVPSLDSAHWRPDEDELEPADGL
jgi:hypothetical protein